MLPRYWRSWPSSGAATALWAGAIGLVQNDIKRVLAYSTVSQLGYMFMAMGVGAYTAGIFHLFTHAFFKALLFLGSGAVIHALAGEQDLRRMGGLKKDLPITYWTFVVGALAIAGVPFLSGFFSKDEILYRTFASGHTLLVDGRRGHVAADGVLHVPARVPRIPRPTAARSRASSRRACRDGGTAGCAGLGSVVRGLSWISGGARRVANFIEHFLEPSLAVHAAGRGRSCRARRPRPGTAPHGRVVGHCSRWA